jgi:hypothetical protein
MVFYVRDWFRRWAEKLSGRTQRTTQRQPKPARFPPVLEVLEDRLTPSVTYTVNVDTSSVSGTGFLDFQFNPGNATSQAATVQISQFTGGTLTGAPSSTGNVAGTLPGTLNLANSTALNEYFQGFTYGASFSFFLTLDGPAITAPNGTATAGSIFGVGLYDAAQNPILTNQGPTTGFVGQVSINLNGSTTPTVFPTGVNGPSVATIALFVPVAPSIPLPTPTTALNFSLSQNSKSGQTTLDFGITYPATQSFTLLIFWGDSKTAERLPMGVFSGTFQLHATHRYSKKYLMQHLNKPQIIRAFVLIGEEANQPVLWGAGLQIKSSRHTTVLNG